MAIDTMRFTPDFTLSLFHYKILCILCGSYFHGYLLIMDTKRMSDIQPFSQGDETALSPAMPIIRSLGDLDATIETKNLETAVLEYATFYLVTDDDYLFFGQLFKALSDTTVEEVANALTLVPDEIVFPPLTEDKTWAIAANDTSYDCYIKRPNMSFYELCNYDDLLARILLGEADVLERLSRHPHPNIIRYHGVRVRRNRITGLVLDKHRHTLLEYVKEGHKLDEEEFMWDLDSAVAHLHSLGLAHNDINPENIMIDAERRPVLIDFGSCRPFGERLLTGGTVGWVDNLKYFRSAERHDISALSKLRQWFKSPWFS